MDYKFYLPSAGAAAVNPAWAYPAVWGDYNSGWTRLAAPTTKVNSAFAYASAASTGYPTHILCGIAQYTTASLAAHEWTTSDTICLQIRTEKQYETWSHLYLLLRVVDSAGTTFRGTLYSGAGPTDFVGSDPMANRGLKAGGGFVTVQNAVSMQANDRLVIEIGWDHLCNVGHASDTSYLRIGDLSANSDLGQNETDTTELCPWLGVTYGAAVVAPTVTTTTITAIAPTTATGGGNVTSDGGATVTARGVCWNTSTDPTTANSHTTDGSGTGVFASSLTSLSPNTHYFVRAYATNSVGTSYGSDVEFTTGLDVTCAIIGVSG